MVESRVFSDRHIVVPVSVGNCATVRFCRYHPDRLCYHNGHCGLFCFATCNIECCFLHLRPLARFQRRKFSEVRS